MVVKTVVCPEIGLPQKEMRNKKPFVKKSSEKFNPKNNKLLPSGKFRNDITLKEEYSSLMTEIKSFNAESVIGKDRRKADHDKLTQLGARPLKQAKMPFKVKLRIVKADKRRESKKIKELNASDVVLARSHQINKKKSTRK